MAVSDSELIQLLSRAERLANVGHKVSQGFRSLAYNNLTQTGSSLSCRMERQSALTWLPDQRVRLEKTELVSAGLKALWVAEVNRARLAWLDATVVMEPTDETEPG